MEAYSTYVRENADKVKKLEDFARFGTILLPKGPLGEVATEGSYSVLGLVSLVNDTIIHGKTKRAGDLWHFGPSNVQDQKLVTGLRAVLTLFAHCEALLEVAATKWSSVQVRDRLIVAIEVIKAICRLFLLKWFPRECLFSGGKYESHVVPVSEAPQGEIVPSSASSNLEPKSWVGRRSGVSLNVPQNMQKYLTQLNKSDSASRETYMGVSGEVLHILRPVVYIVLSKRFKGRWWPFLVSLAMDGASLRLFWEVLHNKKEATSPIIVPASGASHDFLEFRRRILLLLMYLFRSPVYENGLGSFADSLVSALKDVPGLSTIAELIAFQLDFYHSTHFYSSAS